MSPPLRVGWAYKELCEVQFGATAKKLQGRHTVRHIARQTGRLALCLAGTLLHRFASGRTAGPVPANAPAQQEYDGLAPLQLSLGGPKWAHSLAAAHSWRGRPLFHRCQLTPYTLPPYLEWAGMSSSLLSTCCTGRVVAIHSAPQPSSQVPFLRIIHAGHATCHSLMHTAWLTQHQ